MILNIFYGDYTLSDYVSRQQVFESFIDHVKMTGQTKNDNLSTIQMKGKAL